VAAGADWAARQVRDGHRELDLDAIRHAVDELQLHAGPARTVVSIATLKPDPVAHQARHALDWVDRFDGNDAYTKRRPQPPTTWTDLQTEIESIPAQLGGATNIVITGSLRQATAFAVGAALRMVTNTDLAVVQRGQLWASDTPYRTPAIPTITSHHLGFGRDFGVVIEAATPITSDILSFAHDISSPAGAWSSSPHPAGPGVLGTECNHLSVLFMLLPEQGLRRFGLRSDRALERPERRGATSQEDCTTPERGTAHDTSRPATPVAVMPGCDSPQTVCAGSGEAACSEPCLDGARCSHHRCHDAPNADGGCVSRTFPADEPAPHRGWCQRCERYPCRVDPSEEASPTS
jgi:hypothetical protein